MPPPGWQLLGMAESVPSSSETSSIDISDTTEGLCVVRSGDFPYCPSTVSSDVSGTPCSLFSFFSLSAAPSVLGSSGTGTGDSARREREEPPDSRLIRDRERERSACEVGRGVMSGASSNVSCAVQSVFKL
jgi:hypothetical protein